MSSMSLCRYVASVNQALVPRLCRGFYSAFTETGATQTMKTNQMAELKQ